MNLYLFRAAISFLLVVILTGIAVNSCAQTKDSLLKVYNNETIHTFGKHYMKGGQRLRFRDLQPEFSSVATKDLYKKATVNRNLNRAFTITSIAALVASAIIRKDHDKASIGLNIAGIGLNLAGLHFGKHSSQLIDMAIWQRNKEILFNVQE